MPGKHVATVQDLFKQGHSTTPKRMTSAAVKFGLDEKLAARLTVRNLSKVIAAAQFEASRLVYEALQMKDHHRKLLKEHIYNLGKACTFFIHHCPEYPKSSMIWSQGLLHLALLLLLRNSAQQSQAELLPRKLRPMYVHPGMYRRPRFQRPNAVYMKSVVDWRLFKSVEHYRQPSASMCVGSTFITVADRESYRMPTLRQLSQGREDQAEPAIRCWHSSSTVESYFMLQIATCGTYRQARILEHMLKDSWQPKLNYPKAPSEDCRRIPSQQKDTPEFLLGVWS